MPLKKVRKLTFFGPKPLVNPLKNISIFRFVNFLFFIAYKGVFFLLQYRKRRYPAVYCLKQKVARIAIFVPKAWVNPFVKMSFFSSFLTFCFYCVETRFLVLEHCKRHFSRLYCLKKKLEKFAFLDPKHRLTPLEKCHFFDFLNFLFL